MDHAQETGLVEPRWQGLCRLGGVAAIIIAALLIGEVVVYAMYPRPETALEHLENFQSNWLLGLLTLDLLGMIAYMFFIPTMLALYLVLRRTNEAVSLTATALFFVGIATFFATNTAFAVLDLSNQYAAATTDEERSMILAATQAMFALFNENAFLVSYVMVSAAWTMIAGVMVQSNLFGEATAYSGMAAGLAGIVAVLLEHIHGPQVLLTTAISLYFLAIVFLFVWVVLTGRKLYKHGTAHPETKDRAGAIEQSLP
jgi:hypothetical protein